MKFLPILVALAMLCTPALGQTTAIFDNWNKGSVDNNPTGSTSFTISEPQMITYIDTYHWNYGSGTEAGGTISLKKEAGETFGPWTVKAESGSGAANAWWRSYPDEVIPAGTYTIIDSEPETWSQNSGSNGCGFSKVEGYPQFEVISSSGSSSIISTQSGDFKWVGKDADKIGEYDNGNPDGTLDGHFVLNLNLPASTEIKSIQVCEVDENGNYVGGPLWHTVNKTHWMLGVFDHGTQLNMHHVPTLGTFSGPVTFDLYCDDSGWFKPGKWFGLKVTFGDGTTFEKLVEL